VVNPQEEVPVPAVTVGDIGRTDPAFPGGELDKQPLHRAIRTRTTRLDQLKIRERFMGRYSGADDCSMPYLLIFPLFKRKIQDKNIAVHGRYRLRVPSPPGHQIFFMAKPPVVPAIRIRKND
jgi:hypothetical protein